MKKKIFTSLFIIGFLVMFVISCTKDQPAETCDTSAQFLTFSQKLNAYNANPSVATCTALKIAASDLLLAENSCNNHKDDVLLKEYSERDCSPLTGDVLFWVQSDFGYGPITVSCNGSSQIIDTSYSGYPTCGASGCANFNFNAGTYSYSAVAGARTWTGSITIDRGGCTKKQITL